jgi:hypothetical protein
MALAKNITLRYRSIGHVRFQLPEALCAPVAREQIVTALRDIGGVYRVDVHPRQRKLSVRFIEEHCSFAEICRVIKRLTEPDALNLSAASCCGENDAAVAQASIEHETGGGGPLRWLRTRLQGGTLSGADVVIREGHSDGSSPSLIKESTVVEFLNDVLVLFLIKLHWHMIMQHWLRQPWRYRYEWMAAFYLIYLLVRSRRPKS